MDSKLPGDIVYVLGQTKDELGGSEYYQMMGSVGLNVPKVDIEELWPQYLALHEAIKDGLISSCHAVTRGGLGVHLAMVAMAGGLGMEIRLKQVPAASGLTATQLIYSESCGRFIITVAPEKKEEFEEKFSGMKLGRVGLITESPAFVIRDVTEKTIIHEDITELKASWMKPFGELI
jgi:phosphoribosylformylglycinamidine synthase